MLLPSTDSAKSSLSQHSQNLDNLDDMLGSAIAYSPVFAAIGGSVQAGIFLSLAYHWTLTASDSEGWLNKTKEEWLHETLLTRRQLDTIVGRLVDLELISIKYDGMPRKLFYKLNKEAIVDAISRYLEQNHRKSK